MLAPCEFSSQMAFDYRLRCEADDYNLELQVDVLKDCQQRFE